MNCFGWVGVLTVSRKWYTPVGVMLSAPDGSHCPRSFALSLRAPFAMTPVLFDDSADLVRIIGRTICIVSLIVGVLILVASGVESGPDGLIWHTGAIGTGVAFIVSGLFMWGLLRGIAQIRDRVEVLLEEVGENE